MMCLKFQGIGFYEVRRKRKSAMPFLFLHMYVRVNEGQGNQCMTPRACRFVNWQERKESKCGSFLLMIVIAYMAYLSDLD